MVLVTVFALLALFSIISIAMSAGEGSGSTDHRASPPLWSLLGRR